MENIADKPNKKIYFTFEALMYILVFVTGLFFRFYKLGEMPLSDHEAILALNSLTTTPDNITIGNTGQVLLTNFMGVLFYLFGTSNFLARLLTAVCGSLLVMSPLLFRNYFNHRFLLILAAWMAISPTLVALSRQTDGILLFILSLVLIIFFFLRNSVIPSGILFSIVLLSGKSMFWILIPICLSVVYVYLFSNLKETEFYHRFFEHLMLFNWKKFGITTGISFVLLSTVGLFYPANFLGIGNSVQDYFTSWTQISQTGLADVLRGLIFYELPVVILGIIGIIFIFRKNPVIGAAFTSFLMISIVQMILMAEKNFIFSVFLVLPLMISASYFINEYIKIPEMGKNKILIVTLISLAILIFVNLAFMSMFSNSNLSSNELSVRIIFIIAGFGLIAGAGLLAGWALSWKIAGKSFLYLFLIYFIILTISFTINTANLRYPVENEILIIDSHPVESDLLLTTLHDYSEWNYGEKNSLSIFVVGSDTPSLIWLLRDFENVNFGTVIPQNQQIDAIITDEFQNVVQADSFRGQNIVWTSKPTWDSMNANQIARWFLTRRVTQDKLNQDSKIVWVRNDLFPGSEN